MQNESRDRKATALQYFQEKVKDPKRSEHICVCGCVICAPTSATLSNNGSNQWSLHSQWESKKVRTGAVAASAPRTLERISPEVENNNFIQWVQT